MVVIIGIVIIIEIVVSSTNIGRQYGVVVYAADFYARGRGSNPGLAVKTAHCQFNYCNIHCKFNCYIIIMLHSVADAYISS